MKIKSNISKKTIRLIIIMFAFVCSMSIHAQIPGPPQGPTDTSDNNGDSIPLDGGLAVLLAGAAAFGIKKLRDHKK